MKLQSTTGKTIAVLRHYGSLPRVIDFLGYVPELIEPAKVGEELISCRRLRGMSQKQLAQELNIGPTTLGRWER